MADTFDPYYKWLAIPPKDQPPNHYRLLGVELFEHDLDVIESAADQRMAHVRSFQSGQNSALSQKILNELAAARVCLLNPQRKEKYDAELRATRDDQPPKPSPDALPEPVSIETGRAATAARRRRIEFPIWFLPAAIAVMVVLLAGLTTIVLRRGRAKVNGGADAVKSAPPDAAKSKIASGGKRSAVKPPANDGKFLDVVLSPGVSLRLVRIDGSADGRVRPFYLGETEVTEAQWSAVTGGPATTSRLPKVAITVGQCREFCQQLNWLPSAVSGRLRLPSRDEFIYALGDLSEYDLDRAWCRENSPEQVREVGGRKANARGLFDLLGNVWEFAADGRFYGLSSWDSLNQRYLAYSSIPLPSWWSGAAADWQGGNLGFRVAAGEASGGTTDTPPRRNGNRPVREPPTDEDQASVLTRIFAEPLTLPDLPGVKAEQIVIWNQHHGAANDRGTLKYNVRLFSQATEVWKDEGVALPWSPNRDMLGLESPPAVRFDRLRVEVTEYQAEGGGLGEIEVYRGPTNLARGCPAATAAIDPQFPPTAVTDGMIESAAQGGGYWLSPPKSPGWVEIDLAFAEPRACDGIVADRVVVWNQHNGASGDRGTTACHLSLVSNGKEVWRRENLKLDWHADQTDQTEIELPDVPFDRLRVEVASWRGIGGGLGEVEVWRRERNLARDCPVEASGSHIERCRAQNVTDGLTAATESGGGYWLLPDGEPGWVEIDLSPNDRAIGEANGRLGAYRVVAEDDWPLGLQWLARANDAELRLLARRDLGDPSDARELAALGDGWWEIAEQIPGEPRRRLQARALYRYARALAGLPSHERPRLRARMAEALPDLPERNDLYFHEETDAQLVEGPGYGLRDRQVVVGGEASPYGLWMHPPGHDAARAHFALGGRYHRLHGAAGINSTALGPPVSPVTFRISGDGRVLWTSQPLAERGASEEFDVDVSGVESLELSTTVDGPPNWCHAVWIEPKVEE